MKKRKIDNKLEKIPVRRHCIVATKNFYIKEALLKVTKTISKENILQESVFYSMENEAMKNEPTYF